MYNSLQANHIENHKAKGDLPDHLRGLEHNLSKRYHFVGMHLNLGTVSEQRRIARCEYMFPQ
jgi:hypothetical protein